MLPEKTMLELADGAVTACDERLRDDIASDRPVSITFESHDGETSWGEFLNYEDAARLYFWLGRVLGA